MEERVKELEAKVEELEAKVKELEEKNKANATDIIAINHTISKIITAIENNTNLIGTLSMFTVRRR